MNDDTANRMTDIGDRVAERIPEGCGYMVIAFPGPDQPGQCQFVSNTNRAKVLDVVKYFILRNAAEEDWLHNLDLNPTPIIDAKTRKIARKLMDVSYRWPFDESPLGPVSTYDVRYLCEAVLNGKEGEE